MGRKRNKKSNPSGQPTRAGRSSGGNGGRGEDLEAVIQVLPIKVVGIAEVPASTGTPEVADATLAAGPHDGAPAHRLEAERTFLAWQTALRDGGTHVLSEAMLVLDIIDTKTQALLAYIGISLAALIFLLASPTKTLNLHLGFLATFIFTTSLLVIILLLLVASILCLSCLNIIGAHTIRSLASHKKLMQPEYERLVVRVTNNRRNRYLYAHRISIITAVMAFLLFGLLLTGSILGAMGDVPFDAPKSPLPKAPIFTDHD